MTTYHYQTVSMAINELRKRGYTLDFNLDETVKAFDDGTYNIDDFKIVEVHRYEGNSDPADEAVVYAIESTTGQKGVLVSGYGVSSSRRMQTLIDGLEIVRHISPDKQTTL